MRWSMVPVSVAGHSAILAALMLNAATGGDLPAPRPSKGLEAYVPVVLAPPVVPLPRLHDSPAPREAAPTEAPTGFTDEPPVVPRVADAAPFDGASLGPRVESGVPGGMTCDAPCVGSVPVTPPPPPEPITPRLVRAGGKIRSPRKIVDVPVVYPEIARRANVSGEVVIEATIDERGVVTDARVIHSLALLDGAALSAVRQWRYTPTTLNGVPVKVLLTITMNFSLGQRLP